MRGRFHARNQEVIEMNDTTELTRPYMRGGSALPMPRKPRIRNMKEAYDEIRRGDPLTSISYYSFRNAVLSGDIPSRTIGRLHLVNMDDVDAYYTKTIH
jgi:hypothetical protein